MSVRVQDTAGVQAGAGCTAEGPTVAVCPVRRTEFADQWELGDGNDTLFSGSGADVLSGGPGRDRVSYDAPLGAPRRGGVRADLDGRADDGSAGERDLTRTDVENLDGTDFGDVLRGNGRANEIDGVGGADRIFGLGGKDTVTAVLAALVHAGAGADRVVGGRIARARTPAATGSRIAGCRSPTGAIS